ncbi:hypothetical protein B0H13DRAFT_2679137 [Mycena leptocephala]|nr:hypothetical protein B0H13DRAFT_2679137 [Mycena leptocephala]
MLALCPVHLVFGAFSHMHGPRFWVPMLDASTPENFEEIVNASGGYDDLASVVVKHISLALTSPEPTLVILLSYIFEFMGVITALIPALIALTGTATAVTNQCILRGMKVLVLSLTMDPMYRWVAEAVKAGLLQCTILCAVQFASMPQGESDIFVDLNLVVLRLLGKTLVSHAVVTAWRGASADAHKASQIPEFAPLPQYRHWKKIAKLAGERVGMLQSWEASGCPWAACRKVQKRRISSAVQIAKMLITAPPNVNTFIGAQLAEMRFPWRERAFMRVLVDADYKTLKPQISRDIVLFMHSHPDAPNVFFVQFDYTSVRGVTATVLPQSNLDSAPDYGSSRLHAMLLGMGMVTQHPYVLPLQTNSTAFDAGLLRIAGEMPAGADASGYIQLVEEKVHALMQATEGKVIEVH